MEALAAIAELNLPWRLQTMAAITFFLVRRVTDSWVTCNHNTAGGLGLQAGKGRLSSVRQQKRGKASFGGENIKRACWEKVYLTSLPQLAAHGAKLEAPAQKRAHAGGSQRRRAAEMMAIGKACPWQWLVPCSPPAPCPQSNRPGAVLPALAPNQIGRVLCSQPLSPIKSAGMTRGQRTAALYSSEAPGPAPMAKRGKTRALVQGTAGAPAVRGKRELSWDSPRPPRPAGAAAAVPASPTAAPRSP